MSPFTSAQLEADYKPKPATGCLFFVQCPAYNKGFVDGVCGWPQTWSPTKPPRQNPQIPVSPGSKVVLE